MEFDRSAVNPVYLDIYNRLRMHADGFRDMLSRAEWQAQIEYSELSKAQQAWKELRGTAQEESAYLRAFKCKIDSLMRHREIVYWRHLLDETLSNCDILRRMGTNSNEKSEEDVRFEQMLAELDISDISGESSDNLDNT